MRGRRQPDTSHLELRRPGGQDGAVRERQKGQGPGQRRHKGEAKGQKPPPPAPAVLELEARQVDFASAEFSGAAPPTHLPMKVILGHQLSGHNLLTIQEGNPVGRKGRPGSRI